MLIYFFKKRLVFSIYFKKKEMKEWKQSSQKAFWQHSKNQMFLTIDSATQLLGIYSMETVTYNQDGQHYIIYIIKNQEAM